MSNNTWVDVLGTPISPLKSHEINDLILEIVQANQRKLILNANAHSLNLAYTIPWLQRFLNRDDVIVHCDGFGVSLAARWLSGQKLYRVTYAEYIWELARFAAKNRLRMFFLGAQPGVAEQAALALVTQYPHLQIVGCQHGYFQKDRQHSENQEVLNLIQSTAPDILLVGFGMPLQEHWLMENWEQLNVPVALAVGAAFDYTAGKLRRAPHWLTDNGLEWLGRLFIEPKRLWRRYLLGNPLFAYRVLKQKLGIGKQFN